MKDLIIIGSGIAGLTASIYASRYKIDHLVIGEVPGGQGNLAGTVENYPGFTSISGSDLAQKVLEHAKSYDVEIISGLVDKLVKIENGFEVNLESKIYQAKTLILALGASYRNLGIPGEKELVGKGVSYCTTCDAPLYKNKTLAVIGGGDSAITGTIHAAAFASKVYIIHRRDQFRCEPLWTEKMNQISNIEQIMSTEVKEIIGTEKVEGIKVEPAYKGEEILKVDGVFVEIGQIPSSALVKELGVETDERNYVKVSPHMATNIAGVFAAGDLATINGGLLLRQFITSAADGARAAAGVYELLNTGKIESSWGEK